MDDLAFIPGSEQTVQTRVLDVHEWDWSEFFGMLNRGRNINADTNYALKFLVIITPLVLVGIGTVPIFLLIANMSGIEPPITGLLLLIAMIVYFPPYMFAVQHFWLKYLRHYFTQVRPITLIMFPEEKPATNTQPVPNGA
jgi:hypothetical protein